MPSRAGTNSSQPESPNRPFQGVNTFTISISQSSRHRQYSGFQNIDQVGTPINPRRSNTYPPHQERGGLPGSPRATALATIPHNPKRRITITTPEPVPDRPPGGIEDTKNEEGPGRGNSGDPKDTDATAGSSHNISEDFRKRDLVRTFATETLPRLIYLHLLLRLPYLYFSRVDNIFWVAELSMEAIKEMALQDGSADILAVKHQVGHRFFGETTEGLPPAYLRLKTRWEELIDTLMEEWKTLNIISVLLLGVIMTMFQIDGAAQDPVTRYLAFCSLICALISLLHGCMFIVRFSTMRKGYRAAEWALEAQKYLNAFWNVWTMLSMPLLWLTWSIITFIICIMTFMWRSRAQLPQDFVFSVSPHTEIGAQIFISAVLSCGALYTVLIIMTLRRYGTRMDVAWKERIDDYIEGLRQDPPPLGAQDYTSGAPTEEPLPISSAPVTATVRRAPNPDVPTEDSWSDLGASQTRVSVRTAP